MEQDAIDFAALYENEVIYWTPADRPFDAVESVATPASTIVIPDVQSPWVIVGDISSLEKSRLSLIFAAPPLVLSAQDWSIIPPIDVPLAAFLEGTRASHYIFLGPQTLEGLTESVIQSVGAKKIYYFSRFISSLTDDEKPLKLAFWNAMKEMRG